MASSLRPDLPPWRESHCLYHECVLVKSRRRELQAASYATHTSDPFSCFSLRLALFQLQLSSATAFHCDDQLTPAAAALPAAS